MVDIMMVKYKANFTHLYATIFESPIFLLLLGRSCPLKAFYLYLYNSACSFHKQSLHACEFARSYARHGSRRDWSKYRKSYIACSALQLSQLYIWLPSLNCQLLEDRERIILATYWLFYCLQNVFPVVCSLFSTSTKNSLNT